MKKIRAHLKFEYVLLLLTCLLCSCSKNQTQQEIYLNNGLETLKNKRIVNEKFIEGYSLAEIGIIKEDINKEDSLDKNGFRGFKIVLKLNDGVSKEVVENYRVSVRVVPNKNEVVKKQLKEQYFWDFMPKYEEYNGYKYVIHYVKTNIQNLEEIHFGLYHKEGYQGKLLSRVISIKYIALY